MATMLGSRISVTDEVVINIIAAVVVEAVYTVKDEIIFICCGRSGDDIDC